MSAVPIEAAVAVAGAYGAYASPALAATRLGRPAWRPVVRVPAGNRVVLTFDDGPDPTSTPLLLDVLERLNVRATFFLVGEQVTRSPGVARAVVDRGHEAACHGARHRNHLARGPRDLIRDLATAVAVIEEATGRRVRQFRPPYGVFAVPSWAWCGRAGLRRVLWSRWTRDWEPRTAPETIVRRATEGLADGEIILFHDADTYSAPGSWRATLEAIPGVVRGARERGFEPVRLGDALAD